MRVQSFNHARCTITRLIITTIAAIDTAESRYFALGWTGFSHAKVSRTSSLNANEHSHP